MGRFNDETSSYSFNYILHPVRQILSGAPIDEAINYQHVAVGIFKARLLFSYCRSELNGANVASKVNGSWPEKAGGVKNRDVGLWQKVRLQERRKA